MEWQQKGRAVVCRQLGVLGRATGRAGRVAGSWHGTVRTSLHTPIGPTPHSRARRSTQQAHHRSRGWGRKRRCAHHPEAPAPRAQNVQRGAVGWHYTAANPRLWMHALPEQQHWAVPPQPPPPPSHPPSHPHTGTHLAVQARHQALPQRAHALLPGHRGQRAKGAAAGRHKGERVGRTQEPATRPIPYLPPRTARLSPATGESDGQQHPCAARGTAKQHSRTSSKSTANCPLPFSHRNVPVLDGPSAAAALQLQPHLARVNGDSEHLCIGGGWVGVGRWVGEGGQHVPVAHIIQPSCWTAHSRTQAWLLHNTGMQAGRGQGRWCLVQPIKPSTAGTKRTSPTLAAAALAANSW